MAQIGEYSFHGCQMTNIMIPASVTYVGDSAFRAGPAKRSIYFAGDAPGLGDSVFLSNGATTIYYLAGTTGWGATFGGCPTEVYTLGNTAPVLAALEDCAVNPGQTLRVTAVATDSDVPANILTFSLLSSPQGASIDPTTGVIVWRPSLAQAGAAHVFDVQAADNGSPALSASESFTVTVNPVEPISLTPARQGDGLLSVRVDGIVGPEYVILISDTLAEWIPVATNTPASMPWVYIDGDSAAAKRFYRAMAR